MFASVYARSLSQGGACVRSKCGRLAKAEPRRASMRRAMLLAIVMGSFNSLCVNADEAPPPWAFAVNPPGAQSPADDGVPRRIPGSPVAFTLGQLRDLYHVPDWHPDNHPPMPDIVAYGRKPAVFACGFCHLPNGLGRPENSSLAGLSADYIVQQVLDFKSGART